MSISLSSAHSGVVW